ncbi:MAG: RNA degradosome polyphosphate kinase [Candidatus Ancillula sp.]|nr:RNA degradosome polyphosphate kinase [Candidatus Ancillula sp.]
MVARSIRHKAPSQTGQVSISERISDVEYKNSETSLDSSFFSERELSWLDFNERVLQLAEDPNVPLLERVSFSAIFASNLDEFFMVRVAGLQRRIKTGLAIPGATGMEPQKVLNEVFKHSAELQLRHAKNYTDTIKPLLDKSGVLIKRWSELNKTQQGKLQEMFESQIFPILTPLAVDPAHPFPYISGSSISLAIMVQNFKTGVRHFARVKVPDNLPRFIKVDDEADIFISLEDLITEHLESLFVGMQIIEVAPFRITRNEDLDVEQDDAENLLKAIEQELHRRRFGPPVRLEIGFNMSNGLKELLLEELHLQDVNIVSIPGILDHKGLFQIAGVKRSDLKYPAFMPKTHRFLNNKQSSEPVDIFKAIGKGEILLHHPYDSFSTSVQRFIEQAAHDPNVLAVKQTLYRTSGDSPIIDALIDAARAGKQVLALVEIKARFDEEANIEWAKKLEKAGVHVVYGIVGLKTHCKIALVIRNEDGKIKRYSHIGTGNYNPKTARIYTDHGILTNDDVVGEDLTKLFNQLSGYAPKSNYSRLLVAPKSIRKGLLTRIENETKLAQAGATDCWIRFKMNSIVDEASVQALFNAAKAGVKVEMLVRGVCGLKINDPEIAKNFKIRSILGRFLEHSRIYAFKHNICDPEAILPDIWIGSADLMHRNLDRRVEALVRIESEDHISELNNLLEYTFRDDIQRWEMQLDGKYKRIHLDESGKPLKDIQQEIINRSKKTVGSLKLR